MLIANDKNNTFFLHSRKAKRAAPLLLCSYSVLPCQNMGSFPFFLRRFLNYLRRFSEKRPTLFLFLRTVFLLCRTTTLLSTDVFQRYPNYYPQKHPFYCENLRFSRHLLISENRVVAPNPLVASICALKSRMRFVKFP